jgi:cytochrome P450
VLFSTPLGNLLARQTIHDVDAFTAFCVSALAERRQVQIATVKSSGCLPRQDFFHYLLQKPEIEAGSEDVEVDLEAESRLLTIAGSDTSSTALAACFFYLVRNEVSLNKLTSDIRATFSSIDEIRHASLSPSSLPYLRACLDETMRLAPPVPAHIPREVLSSGAVIDGRFYPAGTVVGICTYALHHNADYFPDPFRFYPERWIVDTSKGVTAESVATSHAAFCPFSIGVRGCIGKNLAYLEMSLTLAITLWQYDIRKESGDEIGAGGPGKALGRHRPGEYQLKDVFVTTRDGPVVEFKVRADIHGIS